MSKIIPKKILNNMLSVGRYYGSFYVLIVDNSVNRHEVSDIFFEALKELNITLAPEIPKESFFACLDLKLLPEENFSAQDVIENVNKNLNAGFILACGVENFADDFEISTDGEKIRSREFRPLPIRVDAERNKNKLKTIFKIYIKNFLKDYAFPRAVDTITVWLGKGQPIIPTCEDTINKYPIVNFNYIKAGKELFPDFLAVCDYNTTLEDTFAGIIHWCKLTDEEFFTRRVVLFTDKWESEIFHEYQAEFNKLKRLDVKFDFRLATGASCVKLPF